MNVFQPHYDFGPVLSLATFKQETVLGLACHLGVNPRQIYRWMHHGLTPTAADHVAVRLGRMAYELWPEWSYGQPSPEITDWVRLRAEERRQLRAQAVLREKETRRTLTAELRCREVRHPQLDDPRPRRERVVNEAANRERARRRMAAKRAETGNAYGKAYARAIKLLVENHRSEFERLLFDERRKIEA